MIKHSQSNLQDILATSLSTPVQFLVTTNSKSANNMTTTQCISTRR